MADAHSSKTSTQASFKPLPLVSTPVGKYHVMMYPFVTPKMPIYERAHAYHINRSALTLLSIDSRMYIDALGGALGTSTTAEGFTADFTRHFKDNWYNMANLQILAFYDSAGSIFTNATTAADACILKSVVDGIIADCRPSDVRFVRLQCLLDFTDLITVKNPSNTKLRTTYYLELPQTTVSVLDGNGNARNLLTWHGADDLRTLSVADIKAQIIDVGLHSMPCNLLQSNWNVTDCQIDTTDINQEIDKMIIKLAVESVEDCVFRQLCPGYTNKPHAAVEHIKQVSYDADGVASVLSIWEFHNRLTEAHRPFAQNAEHPVSMCNIFIDGMEHKIRSAFNELYPDNNEPHDRNGRVQRAKMQIILQQATIAEQKVKTIQTIAIQAHSGQSFHADREGVAFASQAENTMTRYNGTDRSPPRSPSRFPLECFGCGGPHRWMTGKEVTCPRRAEPGIVARADSKYAAMKERMRKSYARRGDGDRNPRKRKIDFETMTDAEKTKIRGQVLAAQASSTSSQPGSCGTSPTRGPMILLSAASFATTAKPPLPAPIQSMFPHIYLQLGTSLNDANSPAVGCVVDSAAAVTTGYLPYWLKIAKTFPHCVSRVYSEENYEPITLSGIVRAGDNSITSKLPIAFEFHLPYKTKDGQNTTFIVACGQDVAVNCILGIPFIVATKMTFDAADQVVECKALDCIPFKVDFKRAQASVPHINEGAVSVHYSKYSKFIRDLNSLEIKLAPVLATSSVPSVSTLSASFHTPVSETAIVPYSRDPSAHCPNGMPPVFPSRIPGLPRDMSAVSVDFHDPMYEDVPTSRE